MSTVKEKENTRKFELACDWIEKAKEGETLKTFFDENQYDKVMIYGMGRFGELLRKEIPDYVTVCFDKKGQGNMYGDVVDIDDIAERGIDLNASQIAVITLMDMDRKIESRFYQLGFLGDVVNLYDIVKFYA